MKKVALTLLLSCLTQTSIAQDVNDACLQSMQKVYRFYYHEVLPKDTNNSLLSPEEKKHMEQVIGQLRDNCPQEVIAKMNHFLQEDNA